MSYGLESYSLAANLLGPELSRLGDLTTLSNVDGKVSALIKIRWEELQGELTMNPSVLNNLVYLRDRGFLSIGHSYSKMIDIVFNKLDISIQELGEQELGEQEQGNVSHFRLGLLGIKQSYYQENASSVEGSDKNDSSSLGSIHILLDDMEAYIDWKVAEYVKAAESKLAIASSDVVIAENKFKKARKDLKKANDLKPGNSKKTRTAKAARVKGKGESFVIAKGDLELALKEKDLKAGIAVDAAKSADVAEASRDNINNIRKLLSLASLPYVAEMQLVKFYGNRFFAPFLVRNVAWDGMVCLANKPSPHLNVGFDGEALFEIYKQQFEQLNMELNSRIDGLIVRLAHDDNERIKGLEVLKSSFKHVIKGIYFNSGTVKNEIESIRNGFRQLGKLSSLIFGKEESPEMKSEWKASMFYIKPIISQLENIRKALENSETQAQEALSYPVYSSIDEVSFTRAENGVIVVSPCLTGLDSFPDVVKNHFVFLSIIKRIAATHQNLSRTEMLNLIYFAGWHGYHALECSVDEPVREENKMHDLSRSFSESIYKMGSRNRNRDVINYLKQAVNWLRSTYGSRTNLADERARKSRRSEEYKPEPIYIGIVLGLMDGTDEIPNAGIFSEIDRILDGVTGLMQLTPDCRSGIEVELGNTAVDLSQMSDVNDRTIEEYSPIIMGDILETLEGFSRPALSKTSPLIKITAEDDFKQCMVMLKMLVTTIESLNKSGNKLERCFYSQAIVFLVHNGLEHLLEYIVRDGPGLKEGDNGRGHDIAKWMKRAGFPEEVIVSIYNKVDWDIRYSPKPGRDSSKDSLGSAIIRRTRELSNRESSENPGSDEDFKDLNRSLNTFLTSFYQGIHFIIDSKLKRESVDNR